MQFISASKFKDRQISEKIEKFLQDQDRVTYSKYKIMRYLISKNLWEEFKSWISSMKYQDYWDVPNEFAEDDDLFQTGLKAFQQKFGMSDDEIVSMKEACRQ